MDYAHDSKLVTFLSGALNYQVTHHLFPGVSQVSTCEGLRLEYVRYIVFSWFLSVLSLGVVG